jgi:hypothetical protein
MDRKQKTLIAIAALLIVVTGLFPPWTRHVSYMGYGVTIPKSWSFILSPPYSSSVDISRLLITWVIIAVVTGALCLILKKTT